MVSTTTSPLITNITRVLHIFGVLPKDSPSKMYTFCTCFVQIIFPVGFSLSLFLNVFDSNISTMEKVFLGPTSLSCASVCVRTFNFLYRAKLINECLANVSQFNLKDDVEKDIFQMKIRRLNRFCYGIVICIIVGVLFIFVSPFFFVGNNLPLPIYSPLNWRQQQFDFLVIHIYSCISLAIFAVTGSLPDICVWYLMYVYSIHFEIIGERLKQLGCQRSVHRAFLISRHPRINDVPDRNVTTIKIQDNTHCELKNCITSTQWIER